MFVCLFVAGRILNARLRCEEPPSFTVVKSTAGPPAGRRTKKFNPARSDAHTLLMAGPLSMFTYDTQHRESVVITINKIKIQI